jgi:hypothetical protein
MGIAIIIGAYTQKVDVNNVGESRLRKSFFIYVSSGNCLYFLTNLVHYFSQYKLYQNEKKISRENNARHTGKTLFSS